MVSKDKSIRKAYLFSIAAFFIPCWTASALLNESAGGDNFDAYAISAFVLFGLTSWAPSIGHFYFERKKYALLSGLGRIVLIAAFIGYDAYSNANSPEPMHPYLSFIGLAIAFCWGMLDFGFINDAGKKYLANQV